MLCCLAVSGLVWADPTFPALTGRVVDSANILDSSTLTALNDQLEAHEADTSNQIVVATVPSLQGYDIAEFGIGLASHWQIGTAEDDNGVVLLIAPNERKVRIDVGYGLEGALPDALAGDIIRKRILPSFREDAFADGVKNGVDSIIQAIKGEYQFDPSQDDEVNPQVVMPIFFLAIVFLSQLAKKRFGSRRVGRAVVPAGFAGMMGLVISNNPFIAMLLAVGVFGIIYVISKNRKVNRGAPMGANHNRLNEDIERKSGGRFNSGSGFSGGGGGFGGGGASGGW